MVKNTDQAECHLIVFWEGRGSGGGIGQKITRLPGGSVDDGKGQAITLVSAGEGSFSDGKQVFTSRVPLNCFLGREGVMQVRKYIEDVDLTSNFNGGRPGGSLERGVLLKMRLEREAPMRI